MLFAARGDGQRRTEAASTALAGDESVVLPPTSVGDISRLGGGGWRTSASISPDPSVRSLPCDIHSVNAASVVADPAGFFERYVLGAVPVVVRDLLGADSALHGARDAFSHDALLERTKHVKVWVSYAKFEADAAGLDGAAKVYEQAERHFADTGQKEERNMVLESWLDACTVAGDDAREAEVQAKLPKRIKKRRLMRSDDGEDAGWEEYFDYIFPDEEKKAPSLKILEMAHKWKKQKTGDEDE